MEVAIMVEGQNGLNWPRWQRIARTVEDAGFVGLFRSDHFTGANPPDKDSLELWVSLTWLACNTQRIVFGPAVSPVSFRHPTMTARMAAAVDDLSGGRLVLGLGAGWQEREHSHFGWDLLDTPQRFERFEEGLKVISTLLNSDVPSDFDGKYYHLEQAILLPRPHRPGGPPIMIGGNGAKLTLPLAARYAREWNAVFSTAAQISELNARLDHLIKENGRQPADVRRSLMTCCVFGRDAAEVQRNFNTLANQGAGHLREDWQAHRIIVGEPNAIVDQLGQLEQAGLYRVLLQWLDLDNLEGLEALAALVLPQLAGKTTQ
jgi:F420-dependent oxidoreductase-like protein